MTADVGINFPSFKEQICRDYALVILEQAAPLSFSPHRVILERSEGSRWKNHKNPGAACSRMTDGHAERAMTRRVPKTNAKRTPEGVLFVVVGDCFR